MEKGVSEISWGKLCVVATILLVEIVASSVLAEVFAPGFCDSVIPPAPGIYEPNDDPANATRIEPAQDGLVFQLHGFANDTDEDWIKFAVSGGIGSFSIFLHDELSPNFPAPGPGVMPFTLSEPFVGSGMCARFYDEGGTELQLNGNAGAFDAFSQCFLDANNSIVLNFSPPSDGDYFVRLQQLRNVGVDANSNASDDQSEYCLPETDTSYAIKVVPNTAPLTGTLQGVITDLESGQPVAGATVIASEANIFTFSRPVTGEYREVLTPQSDIVVTYSADGYDSVQAIVSIAESETAVCNIALSSSHTGSADLAPFGVTLSSDRVVERAQISYETFIANKGDGASTESGVTFHLSRNADISEADYLIGTAMAPSIAPNSSVRVASSSELVPGITGFFYVGACIDAIDGESNQTNNCARTNSAPLLVEQDPDIAFYSGFESLLSTIGKKSRRTIFGKGCALL